MKLYLKKRNDLLEPLKLKIKLFFQKVERSKMKILKKTNLKNTILIDVQKSVEI